MERLDNLNNLYERYKKPKRSPLIYFLIILLIFAVAYAYNPSFFKNLLPEKTTKPKLQNTITLKILGNNLIEKKKEPVFGVKVLYDSYTTYSDNNGEVLLSFLATDNRTSIPLHITNGFNEIEIIPLNTTISRIRNHTTIAVEYKGILTPPVISFQIPNFQFKENAYTFQRGTEAKFTLQITPKYGEVECLSLNLTNYVDYFFLVPVSTGDLKFPKYVNLATTPVILKNIQNPLSFYVEATSSIPKFTKLIVSDCEKNTYEYKFIWT